MSWFWEQFNNKGSWLFKIMMLNLIWIGFTLLGGIIFGLFPSTISLFSVIRKWLRGETDINIFRYFTETYKDCFVRSNMVGFVLLAIGVFLSLDLYVSQKYISNFFVHLVLLLFSFLYLLTLLFFFPTFVHYDLKPLSYLKQSFLIGFIRPIQGLFVVAAFLTTATILFIAPVLILFFAGPMLAFPVMWVGNKVFRSFENTEQIM
jgi:uncharacterized membrane protein YesL